MRTKIISNKNDANIARLILNDQKILLLVLNGFGAKIKNGDSILEIGTGIQGILSKALIDSLGSRKVDFLVTDIDHRAVEGAKKVFQNYQNVTVSEGDLFSVVPEDKKFNIIFWNSPWYDRDREGKNNGPAYVDNGYKSIRLFLQQASQYLQPNGSIYVIFPRNLSAVLWEEARNLELDIHEEFCYPTKKRTIVLYEFKPLNQ